MGDYCLNSFPTQPAHKFKYFPESLFKYHYNVGKYCVKQRKREKQKEREGEKELKMNLKISLHSFHISAQQVERPLKTSLLDPLRYLAYINIYVYSLILYCTRSISTASQTITRFGREIITTGILIVVCPTNT